MRISKIYIYMHNLLTCNLSRIHVQLRFLDSKRGGLHLLLLLNMCPRLAFHSVQVKLSLAQVSVVSSLNFWDK